MLSGFFKLARPLPVNLSSGVAIDCELTDFFFTDGVNSISLADLPKPCSDTLVVMSTDAMGKITQWSFEIYSGTLVNGIPAGLLATINFAKAGVGVFKNDYTAGFEAPGLAELAQNQNDPGIWTSPDICTQKSLQSRPIELGVSGGNINDLVKGTCSSGTLGSLIKNKSSKQFILSNNHVLADENKAKRGQLIVQPGLVDTGPACTQLPGDAVATYTRAVPLKFGGTFNLVDAAIAAVNPGDVGSSILNIGGIASSVAAATVGMGVMKMGRTTCFTFGTVTAIHVNMGVTYDNGIAKFKNQIEIVGSGGFSAGRDSGSLVVTQENCPRPVGPLFAGAADGSFSLANPISTVLKQLSALSGAVSMVGSCTPAAASDAAPPDQLAENLGISKEAVEGAAAVRDRHEDELMRIPGASALELGLAMSPVNLQSKSTSRS